MSQYKLGLNIRSLFWRAWIQGRRSSLLKGQFNMILLHSIVVKIVRCLFGSHVK